MTKVRQALGQWGEELAAKYLVEHGMVILDRNWRTSAGEIDIVARDVDALVFVEVKTRRGSVFGDPAESVTTYKTRRLRTLAAQWLAITRVRPSQVRFDMVKVMVNRTDGPSVTHVRGI
jgi:putative endonuclease